MILTESLPTYLHQITTPLVYAVCRRDDGAGQPTRREHVERKLDELRRAMEERGLKISRNNTDGGRMINHLMYADDLVILSPSTKGLQRLVDICAAYGGIHDIKFDHAKTVCMYLPSKGNCTHNSPHISLNLQKLSFVPKFKYLGSFITQDNSDDENMRRQRGNCYARSNGIIKNFYVCSPVVKCDLFKAFCCNMYCSHLWSDFKNDTLRRLIVGYNHSFRIIMKYPRHCSASGMFVFNDVPSFTELWRKSIYGFKQRVDNSLNKVVNTVANTSLLSSKLRKHWQTVLYILPVA